MRRLVISWGACALLLAFLVIPVQGSMIFTGSDVDGRMAYAKFTINGSQIEVILSNVSDTDVTIPVELLTAVFFGLPDGVSLSPVSATLTAGSTVFYGSDGSGNLGGEWAYKNESDIAGLTGANHGISSVGLGVFGSGNFNGVDLNEQVAIDGDDYGLTSAGDNLATGNKHVTGDIPLTQNSVTFMLDFTGSLAESDISNVWFQYGSTIEDGPRLPGVPEPSAAWLACSAFAAMWLCLRGKRR